MSRLGALATAILTILHSSSYVSAQAPICLPSPVYNWTYNHLGKSPCVMTEALGGACVGGAFTLAPLQQGNVYLGPNTLTANACRCSSVYYSLLSACAYCQKQIYLNWSIYNKNCTTVYNQTFVDPLPIVVPHYAYLDVVADDSFNINAAMNAGGPESSPVPQATSTTSTINTTDPGTGNKLSVGAIVGVAIGGIAVIVFVVGLIFFILRRRKQRASTPSTTTYDPYASPKMAGADMNYNSTIPTMNSGKIYDPNDPSTFPPYPPYIGALPNESRNFYSNSATNLNYSTNSGSPHQVNPTITGNSLRAQVHARTQYTGVPEL